MGDITRTAKQLDPARDSALLLQRLGFFTLGVALPVTALLSRRAAVVLVPIGVALLVIAAAINEPERFARSLRRRSIKATTLALSLLAFWTLLSLTWSAGAAAGLDRALNMALALALGLAGIAALPERTRAANLNAVAVGIGAAAVLAAALALAGGWADDEQERVVLVRALALLLVLAAPMTAWLLLRGRSKGAVALLASLAVAVALSAAPVLVMAFAVGVVGFLAVLAWRERAVEVLAAVAAALVIAGPLLPGLIAMPLSALFGASSALATELAALSRLLLADPVRLMTGHGFAAPLSLSVLSTPATAVSPLGPASASVLVDLWHGLGVVGAAAFAATIWFAMRAVRALPPLMQAGAVAAYLAALTFGVAGLAGFRAWWLMTIAAGVILVTAIARGQARTDRPLASFVQARAGDGARPPSRATRPAVPRPPGQDGDQAAAG